MGRNSLNQLITYVSDDLAATARAAARARRSSVSEYLKTLIKADQDDVREQAERDRRDLKYIATGIDAVMDELGMLRAPPPVKYRLPDEKTLRERVREIHNRRFGGSDAD